MSSGYLAVLFTGLSWDRVVDWVLGDGGGKVCIGHNKKCTSTKYKGRNLSDFQ